MTSGGVVEALDVVGEGGARDVAAGEVLVVDVFGLERREEALGHGVVVAVAGAAHARDQPAAREGGAVVVAGVRAASVGVMQQAGLRPTMLQGAVEGLQ